MILPENLIIPILHIKRLNRLRDVRSLALGQANLSFLVKQETKQVSLASKPHQVTTSQFLHSKRIKMNKKSREGVIVMSVQENRWIKVYVQKMKIGDSHPTLSCTDHIV